MHWYPEVYDLRGVTSSQDRRLFLQWDSLPVSNTPCTSSLRLLLFQLLQPPVWSYTQPFWPRNTCFVVSDTASCSLWILLHLYCDDLSATYSSPWPLYDKTSFDHWGRRYKEKHLQRACCLIYHDRAPPNILISLILDNPLNRVSIAIPIPI